MGAIGLKFLTIDTFADILNKGRSGFMTPADT
jgi:hypothetical protein